MDFFYVDSISQRASKLYYWLKRFFLLLLNWCEDFSALWHRGNCNLTWESPQVSTSWPQTPDKGIRTLWPKWPTQEVFDGSHLSGKIEGSQTCVVGIIMYPWFKFLIISN